MTSPSWPEGAGPGVPPRIRPYLRTPPDSGPAPGPSVAADAVGDAAGDGAGDAAGDAQSGLRPFVLTSGRVHGADHTIGLETQVTTRPLGALWTTVPVSRLAPELQAIIALCAEPMSVAEISARLRLHLGVTRILVGDLRAAGYLDVHTVDVATSHDPETILRVMHGLRAIS